MPSFQLKITLHPKNQDDLKLNEKGQSINVNTGMTDMLNYLTTILRQPSYILEINEKKIENFGKEREDIMKNQMKSLELKNTIMKY